MWEELISSQLKLPNTTVVNARFHHQADRNAGLARTSVPDELLQVYKLIEMQGWHERSVPDELYQIGTLRL